MHKLVYFFFIITYLFANSFDNWVDKNINVLEEKVKSISFQIKLEPGTELKENKMLNGKIVIGEKKQFRFEMGPRTVVSDGTLWKSCDERTNQIFIHVPNKKWEKALFSWVRVKKLKNLPVNKKPDGSYKIKLFNKNQEIRTYFNSVTNGLDSILISNRDGLKSIIFNLSISAADSVTLNIGTKSSTIFDFR